MAHLREDSKKEWNSDSSFRSIDSGSLQRIADACEMMALNYKNLIDERNRYIDWWGESAHEVVLLKRQIAGLRGYINRLKNRR